MWIILIGLFLFGATLASFAIAQVWRIRARQLKHELDSGEKVDKDEWKKLKSLAGVKQRNDRSKCLHCGYTLRWYDLIPVVSWLSLGGKCRKCRKPIGATEFVAEITLGALFVASFMMWPLADLTGVGVSMLQIISFVLWLILLVILTILFVYDMKWSLLSLNLMLAFIALSAAFWVVNTVSTVNISVELLINLLMSMIILPGVYWILNIMSKGAWVGSGDWIISIGLVFMLPNLPILTAFVLFLSNFLGTLFIATSSIITKKPLSRGVKIPFGPFLIIATILVFFTYPYIINFLSFSI